MIELKPGSQFMMEAKGLGIQVMSPVFWGPPPAGFYERPNGSAYAKLGAAFVACFEAVRSW